MRRMLCVAVAAVLLLCGCAKTEAVHGQWVSRDNSPYYFELYEDGTCFMFDEADEWVSSGTYVATDDHVTFEMDTGSFVWVRDGETMIFEAGGTVTVYSRTE